MRLSMHYRHRSVTTLGLIFSLVLPWGPPSAADSFKSADRRVESEWIDMLDENAKKRWRGYGESSWPSGWRLSDRLLHRVGGGGDIMTVETFRDFELELEWRVSRGGNSGIIYRVSLGDDRPYRSGMECQVLDDREHRDGRNPITCAGSLYGMYARSDDVVKPVGEWNAVRIVARGNHVEHWLNGLKVVEFEVGSDDWNTRLAKSKFADWPKFAKNRAGHISLQDHGDPVWYRKIRVRRLTERP